MMMYIPGQVAASSMIADGWSMPTVPCLDMYPVFLPPRKVLMMVYPSLSVSEASDHSAAHGSVFSEKVLPFAMVLSRLPSLRMTVAAAQPTWVSLTRRPAVYMMSPGSVSLSDPGTRKVRARIPKQHLLAPLSARSVMSLFGGAERVVKRAMYTLA
jgi:hypothetical protein